MAAIINWHSYVTLCQRENVTTVTAHGRLKLLLGWGVEAPTFVLTNEYKRICLPAMAHDKTPVSTQHHPLTLRNYCFKSNTQLLFSHLLLISDAIFASYFTCRWGRLLCKVCSNSRIWFCYINFLFSRVTVSFYFCSIVKLHFVNCCTNKRIWMDET